MSDPNLEWPNLEGPNPDATKNRALMKREDSNGAESKTMLAIVMGGIGALFIFSIVMAFNYASHNVRPETAAVHQKVPASTPATTGSGASRS